MITQERFCLGSWNFIGTLIMTRRWPLLIFRSLDQRSMSQWLEIVKWFPDENSRKLTPMIMKLHRYIDHDWQMTPMDFHVTRSKVKVSVPKNVFTQWLPLQLTAHMGCMHVLQTALVSKMFSCSILILIFTKLMHMNDRLYWNHFWRCCEAARLRYHTMKKIFTMATYVKDRASPIEIARFFLIGIPRWF
jgi:hypothetical protein